MEPSASGITYEDVFTSLNNYARVYAFSRKSFPADNTPAYVAFVMMAPSDKSVLKYPMLYILEEKIPSPLTKSDLTTFAPANAMTATTPSTGEKIPGDGPFMFLPNHFLRPCGMANLLNLEWLIMPQSEYLKWDNLNANWEFLRGQIDGWPEDCPLS
ncbi:hypothetical protein BT96DRAFT_1018483 [Gymnopus androsaceus JB14]|uniref:Uncharacterized protein n=1 Tax=Gymnopus androsaceus JB14 TaxID=1447944 RepID=A0A6A4HVQ9_9AGAR|nr:hypothetical protein BT96DRAFT_1018483 [Gymnopus androsaceus JB14]